LINKNNHLERVQNRNHERDTHPFTDKHTYITLGD